MAWDAGGRTFWLTDAVDPSLRLHLVELERPAPSPPALAEVLAQGLASCDFPPTGERAAPGRVAATLRAAHRQERPVGSTEA